jgi:hypothetical protein
MFHDRLPKGSLLLARDSAGYDANAFVVIGQVFSAGHVAQEKPIIWDPLTGIPNDIHFHIDDERDIAYSLNRVRTFGFRGIAVPQVNQELIIVGHHGPRREPFEIQAVVSECLSNGRIIVDRIGGSCAQPGMSGSPGITQNPNIVVGPLVEGVKGTFGERLYLETLHGLPVAREYIRPQSHVLNVRSSRHSVVHL